MPIFNAIRFCAIVTMLSFSVLAGSAVAQNQTKEKDKDDLDWQDGIVLDTDKSSSTTYGGTSTTGQVNSDGSYQSTTNRTAVTRVSDVIAIEGKEFVYVIQRIVKFRWEKQPSLTVNGPIRYAVKENTVHFVDDEGRKMKGKIVKKIVRKKPDVVAPPES